MNKDFLMNKIYLSIVLAVFLFGNQGLCSEAPVVSETGPHTPLHKVTGYTPGKVSSFLDSKSQAAFAATSRAAKVDVVVHKKASLLDAFQKAIHCTYGNLFCVVDEQEINGIASHPQ